MPKQNEFIGPGLYTFRFKHADNSGLEVYYVDHFVYSGTCHIEQIREIREEIAVDYKLTKEEKSSLTFRFKTAF